MKKTNDQSGFTAAELLITLFVAAAFLVSGYQLYNVIIKDSGQTRAESRASNVAYDYMRRYSPSAANPCPGTTILVNNTSINVTGLSNAKVNVVSSCPYPATLTVTKIEVTVTYNNPVKTVEYATYVKK